MALVLRASAVLITALSPLLAPGGAPAARFGVVCAAADGANHVAVVVQHADGRSLSRCVSFTSTSVTGEQALDASGIEHQYYDYGGSLGKAVCQVDGEPATPSGGWTRNNCLGYPYWSTWSSRAGGSWAGASKGVSNTNYSDGDAEGFHYGDGSGPPPSPLGVCPRPLSPAPSSASAPIRSPTPAATTQQSVAAAPAPSVSASPTPPPLPTASDEPTPSPLSHAKATVARASFKPSLGWVAAAAAAVALVGMLAVQLLAGRRGA